MSPASRTIVALALALIAAGEARADFALRDGDTVVFLGDSITAARTYGKVVENYTLLRFPGRAVRFVNAGEGGDTAVGGLARLDRDVFDRGATVLVVAYGINDIGWGTKADGPHKAAHLGAIRAIVARCDARKVRAFICSAAITAEDPATAERGYLQAMGDEGLALARDAGAGAIDVQRSMRTVQRAVREAAAATKEPKDRPTLHAGDGVHLNDLGQVAMAYAILKGLGAPAEVSSATLDARGPRLVATQGCAVSNVSGDAKGLAFDRLDDGLPINFGPFGAMQYRFVPIHDGLNRYMLAITGLAEGRYDIAAEGRPLGAYTAGQLAEGVNLASATANGWEPGGPWDAEANALIRLTDARSELAESRRLIGRELPGHPDLGLLRGRLDEANGRLEALQRSLVRPRPFRFIVRPAAAP